MNSFPKFCVVVLLLINIWIVEAGRVNLRSSNARGTGKSNEMLLRTKVKGPDLPDFHDSSW